MSEIAQALKDAGESLARLQLTRTVGYHDEDRTYRSWRHTSYHIEVGRGAWKIAPTTRLGFSELPFKHLVGQVSQYASLGLFLRPGRVEHLDRHARSMIRFLTFSGWNVKESDDLCVVLEQGGRKATFSGGGQGLLLAMAIYALFPRTIT